MEKIRQGTVLHLGVKGVDGWMDGTTMLNEREEMWVTQPDKEPGYLQDCKASDPQGLQSVISFWKRICSLEL